MSKIWITSDWHFGHSANVKNAGQNKFIYQI